MNDAQRELATSEAVPEANLGGRGGRGAAGRAVPEFPPDPREAGILEVEQDVDPQALSENGEEVSTMVQPMVKKRILADLDRLSPEQQERAADLVHGLVSTRPTGASVEDLLEVAGTLDRESARQMMDAIEEGCERVDLNEW
jgi:hypothetical protein